MIENPYASSTGTVIVSVDVNGYGKKPNRLGKDLFMFELSDDGDFVPMGDANTTYPEIEYCLSASEKDMNGAGCTAKMLRKT